MQAQLPASITADGCTPPEVPLVTITPSAFHGTGMNITSHGVLKILIVMVQFPDDDFEPDNEEWPLNGNGGPQPAPVWVQHPEMLVTSIDQHVPGTPFTYSPGSLSEFYYTMTQNLPEEQRLKVYGDVVHHVFPFTREQMRTYVGPNNPNQGMTVATGLDILFNGLPGFPGVQLPPGRTYAIYDNWTTTNYFDHIYQPDNAAGNRYVDLVIVCWRNIARNINPVLGEQTIAYLIHANWNQPTRAHLSWGNTAVNDIMLTEGIRIQTGFSRNGATSGASIWFGDFLEKDPMYRSTGVRDGNFRGLVHEIGHHLLGGEHFTGGPWTMLANTDNRAYCPTAFEMSELGWIEPTMIYQGQTADITQALGDLYTTGDAIAIEINGLKNQWYFLENHQMISPYDYTSSFDNVRDACKGLYVLYHQDKIQHLQSSNGAYDWSVANVVDKPEWNNAKVPVFEQGAVNKQTGFTRTEQVYAEVAQLNGSIMKWHPILLVKANNAAGYTEENYFSGKHAGDQHQRCSSGLWGPSTNPPNTFVDRTNPQVPVSISTGTSFRIVSESGGVMQIRVANNNADIIPPSRIAETTVPTTTIPNPTVAYGTPCERGVLVEWTPVSETDVDHYLITGGDEPVTAPSTASSASITITVGANEGYTSRWVDVFTVDASGNVSCTALDGTKQCTVLSCPGNASKPAWQPVRQTSNKQPVPTVVNIYPQPAREQVTLEISGMRNPTIGVVVYDALGGSHLITHSTSKVSQDAIANTLRITLDVTGLAAGMYSVVLQAEHSVHTLPILIY